MANRNDRVITIHLVTQHTPTETEMLDMLRVLAVETDRLGPAFVAAHTIDYVSIDGGENPPTRERRVNLRAEDLVPRERRL